MKHSLSTDDRRFFGQFTASAIAPGAFHHREHLRLAYIVLLESGPQQSEARFREMLQSFLAQHGIDPTKYHATLTQAWLLAVAHFMNVATDLAEPLSSSEHFIASYPQLLDPQIMMTHYSPQLLASGTARAQFVEPDIEPIPRH